MLRCPTAFHVLRVAFSTLREHGATSARRHTSNARFGRRVRRAPLARTPECTDRPHLKGEGLYGIHSVLQALESGHRTAHALYVREERKQQPCAAERRALDRIHELAQARGLAIHATTKWTLNHLTRDKPHQGVVLDATPLELKEFVPLDPAPARASMHGRSPVILALDEIQDPQNFGAILRSAHFFGCTAVVVSTSKRAPVSPAVSRASVGALEVLVANEQLVTTRNLHEMLATSRDGGWRVVGASSGDKSMPSTQLSDDTRATILVMGNEHRGLRKSIRQCCHEIVQIPGHAATDPATLVDSLNVSVASAILLYELLHD